MKCPRCGSETIELLTKSPVEGAWEVYICKTCCYSYRSTEEEELKNYDLYDSRFKVDPTTINKQQVIPPIAQPIKK